jgi:hypothetical protein
MYVILSVCQSQFSLFVETIGTCRHPQGRAGAAMLTCYLNRSQHQVESSRSYRALPSHPGFRIQCTICRIWSNLRVQWVDFVSRVPLGSLQLAANSALQSTKETRRVIFIDKWQDAVRSRAQAVKAIAQSEVSAIVPVILSLFLLLRLDLI